MNQRPLTVTVVIVFILIFLEKWSVSFDGRRGPSFNQSQR
jgi:hypothetical protein